MWRKWLVFGSMAIVGIFLLINQGQGHAVWAKATEVNVYLDGKPVAFTGQKPAIQKGTTLVPFRTLFEALGFQVGWDDTAKQATGTKGSLKIELTINSPVAKVNGKAVELAVPAQIINKHTMIPLRFVAENSGYNVSYQNKNGIMDIWIHSQAPQDGLEPYVVKGRVVNAEGEPIEGALVTADNQLLYNSNAQARTGADGWYRIPLGLAAATYQVTAEYSVAYNGNIYRIDLLADNDAPFAGNEGAIRHFTVSLDSSAGNGASGYVLFYMMDLIHPLDPIAVPPDRDDVILTLTPIGKQLDGTEGGKPISSHGTNSPNGFGLHNVPIGRYEVTATYAPAGEEPQQMLVRLVSRGKDNPFTTSVIADFNSIMSTIHSIELELKLNVTKPPAEEPGEWSWD